MLQGWPSAECIAAITAQVQLLQGIAAAADLVHVAQQLVAAVQQPQAQDSRHDSAACPLLATRSPLPASAAARLATCLRKPHPSHAAG